MSVPDHHVKSAAASTVQRPGSLVSVLPVKHDSIPDDLRERKQWVAWRGVPKANGKIDKIPWDGSRNIDAQDPSKWLTAREALAVGGDGIAFVLTGADKYCCIDLDKCYDPEARRTTRMANDIINACDSWAEYSPSGTGVHVWIEGRLPDQFQNKNDVDGIEVYDHARMICVTGHSLIGVRDEIVDAQEHLERIAYKHLKLRAETVAEPTAVSLPASVPTLDQARLAEAYERRPRLLHLMARNVFGPKDESKVDYAIACELVRDGWADDEIWAAIAESRRLGSGHAATIKKGTRRDYIERTIKRARAATPVEDGADQRIVVDVDEINPNVATRGLARALGDVLFMRGDRTLAIVKPAADLAPQIGGTEVDGGVMVDEVWHDLGTHLIIANPPPGLVGFEANDRVLMRAPDRRGELQRRPVSRAQIAAMVDAAPFLGFRRIKGVSALPILLPDGSIISDSGYDPRTQLLVEWPHGPIDVPDILEPGGAVDTLLAPFVGYLDRAVENRAKGKAALLAAVLTAVLRPSLSTAPAILVNATRPGCGKGLLATALGIINTGRRPSAVTEGSDTPELEKRIATAVMQAAPCLVLDNLQRMLQSSTLESGLTDTNVSIRRLGTSETVDVDWRALVVITVNNANLRSDMLRRCLPIRLVVATDQPELEQFGFDPTDVARERRDEIVAAGFAIARWWLRQGKRGKSLGSFDQWSQWVAAPVEVLTGVNPIDLIAEQRQEDPRERAEVAMFDLLHRKFENFSSADALRVGNEAGLWDALMPVAASDGVTTQNVGVWLRQRRDKVLGSVKLELMSADRNGVARWRMVDVSAGRAHMEATSVCDPAIEAQMEAFRRAVEVLAAR